jgi:hypothetical protein
LRGSETEAPAYSPPTSPSGYDFTRSGEPLRARHSHGLDQFFSQIQKDEGLFLLDLAGLTQANVAFITSLGHRLYSEDFLRTLDSAFGHSDEEMPADQGDAPRAEQFLQQNLNFPDGCFDGALVWDTLEFLAPPLLKGMVDRLFRILKPGSYLLCFFHAEGKIQEVPSYTYRIQDSKTLLLAPRGMRRPTQLFSNRGIEKLFHQFQSVKFFLARDHLREVIVRR